ncbi:MAG TPA: zf-HC2 domain-containing protein [Thermoanaerobaculia bacterium]|nr:zf-HC2 domain-containing protein [Thermoanaerobaculia bacterium]
MSERHVTDELLQRLHRHELDSAELLEVIRHVSRCAQCARRAGTEFPSRLVLRDETGEEAIHLDPETQLFPWIDGTVDAADREIVETHLEDCALCRAEADDLRRLQQPVPRAWWTSGRVWAAAAAVVFVLAGITAIRQSVTPAVPPAISVPSKQTTVAAYANPEWNDLVADTLKAHRLPFPATLDQLRPPPDPLRGSTASDRMVLSPAGVVVADVRPRFSWTPRENASYVVSIFDGTSEVASSEVLTTPSWTPLAALPEDRLLAWQVEVRRGPKRFLMPVPPAPPALFRVISSDDRAQIATALERHPADHLLHAVLYARAGLEAEASGALQRAAASGDRRADAISVSSR